jgi:hypothetical protein
LKNLILDHSYTPSPLKTINQELHALNSKEDPEQSTFLAIVTQRDEFIQSYLQIVDPEIKHYFVEAELIVNGALVAYASELFNSSFKELTGLVRGRKAIKKYK